MSDLAATVETADPLKITLHDLFLFNRFRYDKNPSAYFVQFSGRPEDEADAVFDAIDKVTQDRKFVASFNSTGAMELRVLHHFGIISTDALAVAQGISHDDSIAMHQGKYVAYYVIPNERDDDAGMRGGYGPGPVKIEQIITKIKKADGITWDAVTLAAQRRGEKVNSYPAPNQAGFAELVALAPALIAEAAAMPSSEEVAAKPLTLQLKIAAVSALRGLGLSEQQVQEALRPEIYDEVKVASHLRQ